ncbi:hypothetical protein [Butyrivibrio sp. INlla21]|uniref:hypothetical protein n=1 Tax=Butyrivibrio sp. INlla21 TaxID=1520811 RepID=UPI0008E9F273|nr:hypothetical protein [Butyrivibrio sp. INlla21]SFU37617.1 hypothetical protein SAMN02910342_00314 [Butyrivibrio sp. INlla21]
MREIESILGIGVKEIIHQDLYERECRDFQTHETYTSYYYDIEFKDKYDGYHHYKSSFDRGTIKFADGTIIDFDNMDSRCIQS